ncbi:hypothetical protein Tco_0222871 [Tanacetum coccineum]
MDFMILDIKENEKRPFILGTPFLTTAKAVIKLDKGTITLRSGKSKVSFHRIPESLCKIERGVKNDIEPIATTMTVNRLVLENGGEFNQWRSKNFKSKHLALAKVEGGMDDEGEVTKDEKHVMYLVEIVKFCDATLEKVLKEVKLKIIQSEQIEETTSASTWMAFGGNTRDLSSFREETDEIMDLHQILKEVLLTGRGDGVTSIKRRRRDSSGDGVWTLATASQRSRKPAFVSIAVDTSRETQVRRKDTIG